MAGKIEVNGDGRDPVYDVLTQTPDADGAAGDIQWNFEKFVVGADGGVLGRFRPRSNPTTLARRLHHRRTRRIGTEAHHAATHRS